MYTILIGELFDVAFLLKSVDNWKIIFWEVVHMHRKEPIYNTPKDTYLKRDEIKPYGGWISISSEARQKEATLRLLRGFDGEQKENSSE